MYKRWGQDSFLSQQGPKLCPTGDWHAPPFQMPGSVGLPSPNALPPKVCITKQGAGKSNPPNKAVAILGFPGWVQG